MRWNSLRGRFSECQDRPFLLDKGPDERAGELIAAGFDSITVKVGNCVSDREVSSAVGRALGFPDSFRGGWDAFVDLAHDKVVAPHRIVSVGLVDAGSLARRDIRTFIRSVCMLVNTSDAVDVAGAGEAQLEFLFWGPWQGYCVVD